ILVEHDVPLVMEVADRVLVLHHGERIAEGDPNTVRNDPRVISAYLGRREDEQIREDETVREGTELGRGAARPEAVVSRATRGPEDTPGQGPAASPRARPGGAGEPLLRVRDIEAGYGAVRVLRGAG